MPLDLPGFQLSDSPLKRGYINGRLRVIVVGHFVSYVCKGKIVSQLEGQLASAIQLVSISIQCPGGPITISHSI